MPPQRGHVSENRIAPAICVTLPLPAHCGHAVDAPPEAPVDAMFLPGGEDILPMVAPYIPYLGINTQQVRLLGTGEIKGKFAFEVTGASQSAIKAIEAQGGTVTLKSITGRERPAADKIKAEKRAAKRAAKAQPKGGKKKAKGEDAEEEAAAETAPKKQKPPKKDDAE